jgi:hypothetical protein
MINYQKSILFEIYNNINNLIYYGITANKRTSTQLAYYKNYYKKSDKNKIRSEEVKNLFKLIDEIGIDNIKIRAIEYLEFENKYELNKHLNIFIKGKICLNN